MIYKLNEKNAFSTSYWDVDLKIWSSMNTLSHEHTFFEFFIVTEGLLTHVINNKTEKLSVGSMRFISPSDVHRQYSNVKNKAKTINVSFNKAFLEKIGYFDNSLDFFSADKKMSQICYLNDIEMAYIDYLSKKAIHTMDKEKQLGIIKILIINCLKFFSINTAENEIISNWPKWFTSFVEELNNPENFTSSIKELCKKTNYTPSSLSVIFKKYTGKTIVHYLTERKINYACNLLKSTNYSMLDISNALGYYSLSHFNHVFKEFTNITPGQYRKKFFHYTNN